MATITVPRVFGGVIIYTPPTPTQGTPPVAVAVLVFRDGVAQATVRDGTATLTTRG